MAMMRDSMVGWGDQVWRDQAACRHADADMFFSVGSSEASVDHIKSAQAVCRRCPVQDACLRFALETNQEAGVWGGKDENERRGMRRLRHAGGG